MLPHCSASVEFETSQGVHHHSLHRWKTFRIRGRLLALTEAQTQEEAALWAVSGQPGLRFSHLYRRSREATHQHGVTATSTGSAAQEAQYKNKPTWGATLPTAVELQKHFSRQLSWVETSRKAVQWISFFHLLFVLVGVEAIKLFVNSKHLQVCLLRLLLV